MSESVRFYRVAAVMVSGLALLACQPGLAASGTWTGAGNAAWTNDANWSASPYPSGTDAATFNGAGGGNTTVGLDGLSSIKTVTFDTAGAAPYILGSGGANAQTLVMESSGLISLANGVVNTQTLAAAVHLGVTTATGTYTFQNASAGSALALAGNVAGAPSGGTPGTKTLAVSGAGDTVISGALSNGGASRLDLTSTSTGILTLSGTNTFSGNVAINGAGTLSVARFGNKFSTDSNLGAGTNVAFGSTSSNAKLRYTGTGETSDRTVSLTSSSSSTLVVMMEQAGTGPLLLTGNIVTTGNGAKQLRLQGDGAAGEVGGIFSDYGSAKSNTLYKTGTGTWTLSGDNQFKGAVTISDGVLRLATGGTLGIGAKIVTIVGDTTSRKPSLQLAGALGPVVVPPEITLRTSNKQTGAIINESGTNTIQGRIELTSGDNDTHVWSYAGKLILSGGIKVFTSERGLCLRGDGDGEVSGVIENGVSTGMPVNKDVGAGTWTLSASNTYSGATSVGNGTLALAGPDGSINASSGVTVTNGAVLRLDNRADANHGDRLKDTAAVTLNNGALAFAHSGGAADYSETAGALSVNGTSCLLSTSQADAGHSSTLTFASLARVGSATLSISSAGLGESDRNRIFITGQADGTIFTWIAVNGSTVSGYDSARGLYGIASPDTDIAAYGDTIVSNGASNVRINSEGTTGPITLSDAVTVIRSLTQNTAFTAAVATAGKTLRAETFLVNAGKAGLTLGAAPNDGVVSAPAAGGSLAFFNYGTNALTVNASVNDSGAASALTKYGSGELVLGGSNSLSGPITVAEGALVVAGTPALPGAAASIVKLGSGSLAARLTYRGTGETVARQLDLAGTTGGGTLEQGGAGLLKFTGDLVYSGAGNKTLTLDGDTAGVGELAGAFANGSGFTNKLAKTGTGTWVLSGANAFSGDTEIYDGTLVLRHPLALAGLSRVVFYSRVPNGFLELAHDGAGETPFNVTLGIGYNGTLLSGVASGDAGINHMVGDLTLSGVTLTVARASSVLNGAPSITAQSINLSGGGPHTTMLNPTTADLILGNVGMLSSPFSKTLKLDGLSSGNRVDGIISNGVHTVSLVKSNSSTWTLTGANTYTGATAVAGGTLTLSGAGGAIGNSLGVTLSGNGVLELRNSAGTNSGDRLANAMPLTFSGGALRFTHDGGAADYSETAGALSVAAGSNTLASSQADAGRSSALTFASLARTGGTVNFEGTELGLSDRNQVRFSAAPVLSGGILGPWATVNGQDFASYGTFGVTAYAGAYTDIAARGPGSVIPDDANAHVRITADGVAGNIALGGSSTSSVNTLQQTNRTVAATVDTATKTMLASGLVVEPGAEALTIGAAAGDGTLAALTAGGELALINLSAGALTVNAALADNTTASSLIKLGGGPVALNGACSNSGPTVINEGVLAFGGHAYPQALAGVISGDGTLVKNGTNLLHLLASNTYTGPTFINEGIVRVNQNSALGTAAAGTFIADGATLDLGCTPDVGGTRAKDGLNMQSELITVQGAGANGQGAIINNSTSQQSSAVGNLTLAGNTTVSANSRWDLRNGTFGMNDHGVTKIGADTLALTYENVVPGGDNAQIDIQQGALRIQVSSKLNGNSANTIRVRSGAALELYRVDNAQSWGVVCESNSTFNLTVESNASTQNRWTGPVTLLDGAVTLTGGTSSSHVGDLQGVVSGSGSITKTGAATITISGTNNTYTGETRIAGGRLVVTSLRNIGEACSLGLPEAANAGIKIGSGGSSYALEYAGAGDTSDRPIDMAGTTGGASIYQSGTGPLKLTANLAVSGTGSKTLAVRGNSLAPAEFAGVIANVGGNSIALTKADAGDWLLSGNNTYSGSTLKQGTGTLTVSGTNACSGGINVYDGRLAYIGSNACSGTVTVFGGALLIAGANAFTGEARVNGGALVYSGANAQGSANISLGYNTGSNGVMRVLPGADLTGTGAFLIGGATGSAAALYMTGGTVARTPADNQSNFGVGVGQNSYGYFNVSGGTLSNVRFQLGGTQDPKVGVGIGRVTGGTLSFSSWILIGRQTNSVGVLTLDGGIFNHVNAGQNVALAYGGGRGELNLTGGTLNSPGRSVSTGQYNAYAATGIVNLCAGTLAANAITNQPGAGVAVVNFSGGTLKACVNTPVFMPAELSYVNVNGPFGTYAGGAVIDTDGKNVTVSAPLRAPGGQGVASVALASPGSGYIGEPYVSLQGGGVGATAVANMEDDGNGAYRVASVTVTAPGWDYSAAPAVVFSGGGTTNQAVAAGVTLAPNTSGGLTKLGAGTLTLSGTNTYSGMTTVSNGTLRLGIASALPPNAPVTLAGGTLDLGGFTVTNSLTALGGLITNGTLQTVISPAGAGVVGTQALGLSAAAVRGAYLADVTAAGDSDRIAVTGNIDLAGLTLQIVDPGQLNTRKQYTLLTCSGIRSGAFTALNLPDSRWHLAYLADGTVKLVYVDGTLIRLQ